MAKAGLTHGGFYAHFASKDDFVAQAIGQMFDESRGHWRETVEGCPPAEGLAGYIDFYLSPAHRGRGGQPQRACPIVVHLRRGVAEYGHRAVSSLRQ